VANRGWKRPFDDPIPLPRGRQFVTLEDAANYIQKLPKAEQDLDEWQAAIEALKRLVDDHDVELWSGARLVIRLSPGLPK
jgi:hypothetical protein